MANEKRLIDANALGIGRCNPDLLPFGNRPYAAGWNGVVNIIDNAPTVDAVEVVHGRWVKYEDYVFNGYYTDGRIRYRKVRTYYCDKCGYGTVVKSNYCSNCGAYMEGERNG